ncbi:uncharacterized protein LOC116260099 [Nymphaea colorata]|nr:uncharacterized protein LOC116260099 [Nymphaea colorata]
MEAPASPTPIDQGELNLRKRLKSHGAEDVMKREHEEEEEELERLLLPDPDQLPVVPPSAVHCNFVADFLKTGHDHYIYRHANGLRVVCLAPTHVALAEEAGITAVDFNTRKTDKSEMKVIGKRKKAAREGYVAILMPKPEDWLKSKDYFLNLEEYKKLRGIP